MSGYTQNGSQNAINSADRDRVERSSHGGLGAAGYIDFDHTGGSGSFLSNPGEVAVVNPPEGGLGNFQIAVAWDNIRVKEETNIFKRFFKTQILQVGVDLDLGCLYKLKNGARGGLQAFGDVHGALEDEPYIRLSHDERTGDRKGPDEMIIVNGGHWDDIEQILIYTYIYEGARDWASVKPQIQVRVPGEQPMIVRLGTRKAKMSVCAVASLDNVRGGIKMTSLLEYFPGHLEMDRAFGYGLPWEDGKKPD
ncbi:MAG: Tellurium resistance protein TerA [Micavibrio aeruginosavorus]|uniref:Tellurium resistance protein TerA n=1 Tax=Micavibrio aeruginosavorus TaxID=349221 RepID=A0A2W5A3L4_9BACT|nr:MAG: Tellurium resistance protein TerA [Micavibrio aeruginosavorus]